MSNTVRHLWIASIFLAGTAASCGPSAAQASEAAARTFEPQDAGTGTITSSMKREKKSDKNTTTRTFSGCLQKGEDADEYNLTTKGGATWELKSDSVKLDEHVGHSVKVTGVVVHGKMHEMKEDTKSEMKEQGMDKEAKEHGHIRVTDVTVVSESCQK